MISVIVIDDEQLIASSLATLLELEEDLVVVATFYSGEAALSWWNTTKDATAKQVNFLPLV